MNNIIGVLLAAGHSKRFGVADKLMQSLSAGDSIALTAAKHLIEALPNSVAVVRQDNAPLATQLQSLGFSVVLSRSQDAQMADNLALAVHEASRLHPNGQGVVIALADMPFIQPATIALISSAIASSSGIVIPHYHAQRGHPVGFAKQYLTALMRLTGDTGARNVIQSHSDDVYKLAVEDAGILLDIDTPEDLARNIST